MKWAMKVGPARRADPLNFLENEEAMTNNERQKPCSAVDPALYDEEYFERGIQTQKSGYQNDYGFLS